MEHFFFKQKYILFLETHFFKIPKNLIASAFFLLRQMLKIIGMPWQKPQHLLTAKANFEQILLRQMLKIIGMPWQKPQHLLTAKANFEHC